MTKPNTTAFPFVERNGDGVDVAYEGLTKREYFAAMAMQGLLANTGVKELAYLAHKAVQCADLLIADLNQPVSL